MPRPQLPECSRLSRRVFLGATFAATTSCLVPRFAIADHHAGEVLPSTLRQSPLVYISPLRSDGQESRCHGEVWFVADGGDLMVVTKPERWRAAAIGKGLDRARLWVGDHGVWKDSKGSYKQSPSAVANARLDRDPKVRTRVLAEFGTKYNSEWSKWGPSFRDGLSSGERVLIRYSPLAWSSD